MYNLENYRITYSLHTIYQNIPKKENKMRNINWKKNNENAVTESEYKGLFKAKKKDFFFKAKKCERLFKAKSFQEICDGL